jgi:hypothetical protein
MTHLRHWTSHFPHRSDQHSSPTYNEGVICPVCRQRRGRRVCPALNDQICAICCGTKRLVEIRCPSDCPYLATAREHPPAVAVRQQRQDLGLLVEFLQDLNTRQSQLFFLVATLIARYRSSELESIVDLRNSRARCHLRTSAGVDPCGPTRDDAENSAGGGRPWSRVALRARRRRHPPASRASREARD